MKDAEGFVVIGGTVSPGHAHAAEAEGGDRGAIFTEFSDLHLWLQANGFFGEMRDAESRLQHCRGFSTGQRK
jgi:hypothetical protein